MKPNTLSLVLFALLIYVASTVEVEAVSPPPDGCYPGLTTAEGCSALFSLTSGTGNTAIGHDALFSDTEGSWNTGVGAVALGFNDGEFNTAVGAAALLLNTTGSFNTAVGTALVLNDGGSSNTALGYYALKNNVDGGANTAIGVGALANHGTGFYNTAIGYQALLVDISGEGNTALGSGPLDSVTTGENNTGLGRHAGNAITEGSDNVCVGFDSGIGITTGTGIITIGQVTGVHSIFGQVDNRTYIANILGAAVDAVTAHAVYVDADGRLGTFLAAAGPERSVPRPTTPKGARPQANPEIDAMLNRKVEALEAIVVELRWQLKEQAAQIQKVSAQIEASKPAPQTVRNTD
jgi:hypothetical protein